MVYVFAGNIERGMQVRPTLDRGPERRAYGEFVTVQDRLVVTGGKLRLLFDDGSVKRCNPDDVFEIRVPPAWTP